MTSATINASESSVISALLAQALASLDEDPTTARRCVIGAERLLPPVLPQVFSGGLAPWQAKRVRAYVETHLDGPLTLPAVAMLVRLSTSYFSKSFRRSFGQTFKAFVMDRRIERAQRLMVRGDLRLCEIAITCGFSDQAHFSRSFRQIAGVTPGRWRRLVALDD
jgi:AraC-like DNA-binding protein